MIVIQLPDGEILQALDAAELREAFVDEGWNAISAATFLQVDADSSRALVLSDVITDADDQFRYYRGTLRDVETGAAVGQPIEWDVRWLR